jgi:hypothetical protein
MRQVTSRTSRKSVELYQSASRRRRPNPATKKEYRCNPRQSSIDAIPPISADSSPLTGHILAGAAGVQEAIYCISVDEKKDNGFI